MSYKNFPMLKEEVDSDFNPNSKLRNSVHDIIIKSEKDVKITFVELSNILLEDYKINIPTDILKEILNDWDLKKNYTIFKKSDNTWLDVWGYQNYIKSKLRSKQNFGKHRWKNQWKSTTYTPPATTNWRNSYPPSTTKDDDMSRFGYHSDIYYD